MTDIGDRNAERADALGVLRLPGPDVPLVEALLDGVAGSGRRFGESDLGLAEELAGQAAAVIDRARRHDRQREAAHTLQRSFLPDELPLLAGAAAAARYLPGTEGAEVGGDWYDVIPLAAPAGEPEALCDLIIERVVEPGVRDDDVALLVLVRR